jgi:hypothetical protein
MDIFSLDEDAYTNGKLISGIESILWVERYADAGEFKIIGTPKKTFMDDLALGTLISHSDTTSVMMVENHSIDETKDGDIKIEITGRTIDAIAMENRIIAYNALSPPQTLQKYVDLPLGLFINYASDPYYANRPSSWGQIEQIVYGYLIADYDPENDAFPYGNLNIRSIPSMRTGDPVLYRYKLSAPKLGNVYEIVKKLLDATKSGIKIERPNTSHSTLDFVIHQGLDLSSKVQFNWASGDLETARYLWTNKDFKNAAYVGSDSFGIRVIPPLTTGWGLRFTSVDMGDVSQYYSDPNALTTTEYSNLESIYTSAGKTEIAKYKSGFFMDATVSKNASYQYGNDYNIGDIVYVIGNYGAETKMKITEFARTIDSSGESGIPTLSPI